MRSKIDEIQKRTSFRQLFKEYFPKHFRSVGASLCPFHEDHNPSFQVGEDHGFCHAGCRASSLSSRFSVIDLYCKRYGVGLSVAVGSLYSALFQTTDEAEVGMRQYVKSYGYRDERGDLLYEKLRYEPKSFSWRRPRESGGYSYSLGNVRRVLYNLPAVSRSNPNELILFVEGEKDVDALTMLGYLATTSGSAKGWGYLTRNFSLHLPLRGHRVWVIADKDDAGRGLAREVATTLSPICPEVKILELPGPEVNDTSDLIELFGKDTPRIIDETGKAAPLFVGVESVAAPVVRSVSEKEPVERRSKFRILDEILVSIGWEFFFDQFGELWVSRKTNDHHENVYVNSERFRDLVRAEYKAVMGDGLAKETIDQVIGAKRGGLDPASNMRRIEYRLVFAPDRRSIMVDSGRSDWAVIRIFKDDFTIDYVNPSPFRRDANCAAFEVWSPTALESWDRLFEVIPVKDSDSRGLIKMWMALSMIPEIAKPGLIINGPPGAGKSFCAETIRQIVDPSENPLQAFPRDIENLKLALFRSHIPNFDNLNRLDMDQSDCLCQAVTGISYEKRKLHTDAETITWKLRRQWILTGVNIPGTMADFLSRTFIVELAPIDAESRKDTIQLSERLREIKAGIQARIFECASHGLRNFDGVRESGLQRLAAAHRYCLAMSEPLELTHDEIDKLWAINSKVQATETIASDVVAQVIIDFMKQEQQWCGTASQLHEALTEFSDATSQPWRKQWPATSSTLSKRLKYVIDSLKTQGVHISDWKSNGDRLKKIWYEPVQEELDMAKAS